jgi:hypothetical protein
VAQEVAAGTVVACDAQMCAALTASGLPAAQQVQLGMNSQSLSGANLVVVTPVLRALFSTINPSLGYNVAPAVLASFGQITVQVVYPAGGAAYAAALSQDVQARIQLGTQLLNSGRVSASSAAQSDLAAGEVDSRVLLALQALANQQPVDVVAFADSGPGAGAGIPFRAVDLATTDPTGNMPPGAYLQSMVGILRAHATFPAFAKASPVTLTDGQRAVQIQYAAPSPLGLLAP